MAKYPTRLDDDARFLRVIGWIFLAITIGAFVQSYFIPLAQGNFAAANFWMHPHAVVSFIFAALFIAQPWLVLKRNWRWHKVIGWTLGLLVAGAVITGVGVQFGMWPVSEDNGGGRVASAFRLFQLLPTLAIFFVAAVLLRKRPDWHWRLMMHSAYAPVGTALGRFVRQIPDPPMGGAGQFLSFLLVMGILGFLASDWIRYRRIHAANWIGLAFHLATMLLSLMIGFSDWYTRLTLGN